MPVRGFIHDLTGRENFAFDNIQNIPDDDHYGLSGVFQCSTFLILFLINHTSNLDFLADD